PAERVTCEQAPASDLRLLAPQASQLAAQDPSRRALGDTELDDVPGDAHGAAHREAQDLLARHGEVGAGAMCRRTRAHGTVWAQGAEAATEQRRMRRCRGWWSPSARWLVLASSQMTRSCCSHFHRS